MLVAILLVASSTFAQEPGKITTKPPHIIAYAGPVPDPAVQVAEAHVRVINRPGLGVVIAIDDYQFQRRQGDGIIDRIVIFQGADEVEPFDGIAVVHIRRPPALCQPPKGVSLIDPEHPWVCPAAPKEVIVSGEGIRLAAFVGARSKWVPANAVVPSGTVGITTYTGRMIAVPLAQIDTLEFPQP